MSNYKEAVPVLGPEYFIPVSTADINPLVLMEFNKGQGDPIYALASRLVAYNKTKASIEELQAAETALSNFIELDPMFAQEKHQRKYEDTLMHVIEKLQENGA